MILFVSNKLPENYNLGPETKVCVNIEKAREFISSADILYIDSTAKNGTPTELLWEFFGNKVIVIDSDKTIQTNITNLCVQLGINVEIKE